MSHRLYCLFAVGISFLVVASPCRADPLNSERIDQIVNWLNQGTYSPTPAIEDRAFWQKVGRSEDYQTIITRAESLAKRPAAPLPDDLYVEYSRNGNRTRYEKVYFSKLKAFRILVVAECVENKGRFLRSIDQAVASYAADKTWVLPAHDSNLGNFQGRHITIDLFSSEVACELATADHLLTTRLDAKTRTLIRTEVTRRIFKPYSSAVTTGKPRLAWLTSTNNWNAVCLANVTGAALALLEKKTEKAFYIASAEKYIASYFKGFTSDGYCSEGIGYWNYGYGCFVRLAHMINEATSGHLDLFSLPKAKAAGLFARHMEIIPGMYPAFADCSIGSTPSPNIMHYVTRRYHLPPAAGLQHKYQACRWLDQFGLFAFMFDGTPSTDAAAKPALRDWFEKAGVLICRGARTTKGLPVGVAIKGGNNAEHHNHNDVGSYVFCIGNAMPLVDPGAEVYTRRTFSSKRYTSNALNSFGHPVPLVAGKLQRTGRSAMGKILTRQFTDQADTIQFDLTSAYAVPLLKQLTRTFVFDRRSACLTVTDHVQFDSPQSFGNAVITLDMWKKIGDNCVRIGRGDQGVTVEIDSKGIPFTIEASPIEEDMRGGRKPVRLGIKLQRPVRIATITLTIRPADVSAR